ncbi:MAG: hypothetical protein ACM3Q4_01540 [Acidobacteriota bacterium]
MKHFLFVLFIAAFAAPLCAQQELPADAPLAKVGRQTITNAEFLSRYELSPGLQRHIAVKTDEKKAEVLFTLIAEKLLAQKAREEGLDRDTSLIDAVRGVERLFVRDELYRREVRAKVSIAPKEIEQAMRYAQQDLKVYFLYARTQKTADSLYALIQAGTPLESVSCGSGRQECEGPDSAITRWGDADERMENAVYRLALNETARPVRLDDGFYIPKLMGKTLTFVAGEKEKKALRERVEQTLRKRKEQARMFQFIESVLKDAKAEVKAKTSKAVIMNMFSAYEALTPEDQRRTDSAKFVLTPAIVHTILSKQTAEAGQVYVTFPHTAWTLETTLEKMRIAGLAVERPTLTRLREAYEERLHDLIDQEQLTRIGYERGLQHTDNVQKQLGPWRDWYLAQTYKNTIEDTIRISQRDVENEKWRMLRDTVMAEDTSKARQSLAAARTRYVSDRLLGSLADRYGITIYEKNLSAVKVTSAPALVYRYLGFGGRMFAVPLTEPNVQWVNFWKRKNLQLP